MIVSIATYPYQPNNRDQSDYILEDPAHYLFAAQQALDGRLPYQDFFWHYGPLPLYSLAGWGAFLGISVSTLEMHQAAWNIVAAILFLRLVTRSFGVKIGLAVFFLTGFGWLSISPAPYSPIERTALFAVALQWGPPWKRRRRDALLVGALFGLLQGIRFGTAVLGGAAWVLADLLALFVARAGIDTIRHAFFTNLATLTGFLIVQSAWVVLAFTFLDSGPALMFLWPAFHNQWYASYVTAESRFFRLINWRYFVGGQLPLLVCAAAAVLTFVRLCVRGLADRTTRRSVTDVNPDDLRHIPALHLAMSYLLGSLFLFKHVGSFVSAQWMLAPILGGVLHLRRAWAWLAVMAMVPCAILPILGGLRAAGEILQPSPAFVSTPMPNGQRLWLAEGPRETVREITDVMAHPPSSGYIGKPGVFLSRRAFALGSGWNFFLNVPSASRRTWIFPGAIHPWEMAAEFERYRNAAFLAILLQPGQGVEVDGEPVWRTGRWLPFSPEQNRELAALFLPPVPPQTEWLVQWRREPPRAEPVVAGSRRD